MNKIICNSIEFVFVNEIKLFLPDKQIVLKPGLEFKKLNVISRPKYVSDITSNEAGPINKESVSAVTKYDEHSFLRKFVAYPVVLRMKTDKHIFFVGSPDFPVIVELSTDKIFDTYTFTCHSKL